MYFLSDARHPLGFIRSRSAERRTLPRLTTLIHVSPTGVMDSSLRWNDRAKLRQGFSLVELSIVLVILGLLVGGILTGRELILAAKMRSTLLDVQELSMHIRLFKARYRKIPGDMNNATTFFGVDAQNGNGDNMVENYNGTNSPEPLKAWQHLYLAKYLDFPYPGVKSDPSYRIPRGVNVPPAPLADDLIFWFRHIPPDGSYFLHFKAGHYLVIAKQTEHHHYFYGNHGTTPEYAKMLDMKVDDGSPISGMVMPQNYHGCIGATEYKLQSSNEFCHVYFKAE